MFKNIAVKAEQIKNKRIKESNYSEITGNQYRASGNLFICTPRCKTAPAGYSGNRGSVVSFSAGSGVRMRRYLRECVTDYGFMVTLTYPAEFPCDGKTTKEHLRRFLQELRREDDRLGKQYIRKGKDAGAKHSAFWFLEFQERGAPHYHIFTNRPVSSNWCSETWYRIVGSKDARHFRAGTRCEKLARGRAGTISYASKYAAKQAQKLVPAGFENVGRFWGVYGHRICLSADVFVSNSKLELPEVLRAVEKLEKWVDQLIESGVAEVLVQKDGCLVVVCHNQWNMLRIRRLTSAIGAETFSQYDYFEDAEVDDGD